MLVEAVLPVLSTLAETVKYVAPHSDVLAAPPLSAGLLVTQVTVPGLSDVLNNANVVVDWAGPIVVIALAMGVGIFGVRFIISRIQNSLGSG
jgi:hypothetical protein